MRMREFTSPLRRVDRQRGDAAAGFDGKQPGAIALASGLRGPHPAASARVESTTAGVVGVPTFPARRGKGRIAACYFSFAALRSCSALSVCSHENAVANCCSPAPSV